MMNNQQLAETFTLIANLSEIKGEMIYQTLANRKAAEHRQVPGTSGVPGTYSVAGQTSNAATSAHTICPAA